MCAHLLAVWVWFFAHFSSRGSKSWKYDRARTQIKRKYLHFLGEGSTKGRYRSWGAQTLDSEREGCVEAVKETLPSIREINHIQRGNHQRLPHPDPTNIPKSQRERVWKTHTAMKRRPGCCNVTLPQRGGEPKSLDRDGMRDKNAAKRWEFFLGSLRGLLLRDSIFSAGGITSKTGRKCGWPERVSADPSAAHSVQPAFFILIRGVRWLMDVMRSPEPRSQGMCMYGPQNQS